MGGGHNKKKKRLHTQRRKRSQPLLIAVNPGVYEKKAVTGEKGVGGGRGSAISRKREVPW